MNARGGSDAYGQVPCPEVALRVGRVPDVGRVRRDEKLVILA